MLPLPDPEKSRALLIGVDEYTSMADLPSVANNIGDLASFFEDADLWRPWRSSNCRTLVNPRSPNEVLDAVHDFAEAATDTFLIYFAGHGMISHNGELYLALRDSHYERLYRAVPYESLRHQLVENCTARRRVIILDCCYSGRALVGHMSASTDISNHAMIDGTYLMTASSETKLAWAPEGERHTAFTGELIKVLENGIPEGPQLLDMETLFWHIRSELHAKSRPIPQQRARNAGSRITLVRNRAYSTAADTSAAERVPPTGPSFNWYAGRPTTGPNTQDVTRLRGAWALQPRVSSPTKAEEDPAPESVSEQTNSEASAQASLEPPPRATRPTRKHKRIAAGAMLTAALAASAAAVEYLPAAFDDRDPGRHGPTGKPSQDGPASSATPSPTNTSPDDGFKIVQETDFEIQIPSDWKIRIPKTGNGQYIYLKDDHKIIVVPGRDATTTTDQPLEYQETFEPELESIRNSSRLTVSGVRTIEVSSIRAASAEYTWQNENDEGELVALNYVTLINGRYHIVLAVGPAQDRDALRKVHEASTESYRAR